MVIDVIMYNGEKELFDLRYNILKDYVDEFIVCEAPTTFSGKPKPLYFEDIKNDYPNVKYFIIDENYTQDEIDLAESSPNTRGATHWKHEFLQKESIKKALTHLDKYDTVFIGDCDEIWDPSALEVKLKESRKLKLIVYTYYLNNLSSEEFWGTLMASYWRIKDSCLNHLRTNPDYKTITTWGWHFTSMAPDLRRKLEDSYTKETYANDWVMDNLEENVKNNRDFLGRSFCYYLDESEWPKYLKDHRDDYGRLLLDNTY